MFSLFNTALSGLSAAQAAVGVVGNNLANLNTTGFKATSLSFHDLMTVQMGAGQSGSSVGTGVGAPDTVQHFTQGTIQQTTGPFDAAIQGQGFFMVRDGNQQQLLTRAGNFSLDATGHLMTATGEYVQGWTASNGIVNTNAAPGDITVPVNGVNAARPTSSATLSVNLDASGTIGDATGTYSAPLQVVDSLGMTHTLTITFKKTAANSWNYTVNIPASDLKANGTTQIANGTLAFDGTGSLPSDSKPVDIKLTGLANGAADQTVEWNLASNGTSMITQFAQKSGVSAVKQDGVVAGQITSVGLEDGGFIVAKYSSGQQQIVGQLAIASVSNPESLKSVGNNELAPTPATSAAAIGTAATGGRGSVVAGALESSTVDIATEFTNLITFQRSYSANSKVITSGDEMLQDLINIKR